MFYWPVYNYPKYHKDRKIWVKIRFLHETDKAILVLYEDRKMWIAKSMIYKVRLNNRVFDVYVRESVLE